jgi:hypothetical protein
MSIQPTVFLNRDGTINEQMGYINHISRFVLLPGVGRAIRKFLVGRLCPLSFACAGSHVYWDLSQTI